MTGNLDEVAIEQIQKGQKQYEEIQKRKETILKPIEKGFMLGIVFNILDIEINRIR